MATNDKENMVVRNITQKSSITDVSPSPSIQNPFRVPLENVTNQSNPSNFFENSSTHTVPLSCVFDSLKDMTQRARVARKEILDNRRTIGLTTSNRGTHTETQSSPSSANLSGSGNAPHPAINRIGYREGIQRSTTISARKRKTLGSPPSVNSKTRQTKARQGSNMTGQSNQTLPRLFVTDANPEAIQRPFQQTETNQFVPPPRFIVENHPEAYNNRYEMESDSETENEDDENQTYTNYPAGESLITPSPQHIPQQTNHTICS
ncbi:hypothetical protein Bca52824_018314 [Brassica carinata]|uniref:Uncharacterized protein n=1 Tax=Brassica carinata TaxID=52824 RepID=A0A8X8AZA8_BRACI|nr:hypothetical protein Bca52824_018314 [Brassica carinata]